LSHVYSPFLLTMADDPDFSQLDLEAELYLDAQRQRVVDGWIKGELPIEALLDMASDHRIDGYAYEDMICVNVDALIAHNQPIDDAERVLTDLWLPNTI
jgi:hypothetical protein